MAQTKKAATQKDGAQIKITGELRANISQFLAEKFDDIRHDWDNMETKERTALYNNLLKYAVPALQSVEYSNNDTTVDDIARKLEELKKEIPPDTPPPKQEPATK